MPWRSSGADSNCSHPLPFLLPIPVWRRESRLGRLEEPGVVGDGVESSRRRVRLRAEN